MKFITKTEQKRQLRKELEERERCLTQAALSASNQMLTERFLQLKEVLAAQTILLYCSMGAEPDTRVLLGVLQEMGKKIVLPRCMPDGKMEMRLYIADLPLIRHPYGMLEPGNDHPLVDTSQIDLALVPALAYDAKGMRLGRGGGFYDRYLVTFSGVTVGLCRDALLQTDIPAESHDCPVDVVVTETCVFRHNRTMGSLKNKKPS